MLMKFLIILFIFICVFILVFKYKIILEEIIKLKNRYFFELEKKIKNTIILINKNEIIKAEILLSFTVLFIFIFFQSVFVLFFGIITLIIFPKIYIDYKQKNYISDYVKNIPQFIESVISSLKAGLSISSAFKVIAEKDKSPIGKEIEDVLNKVSLGKSFKEALLELSDKIKVKENEIVMAALSNGIETGGNISLILENILKTIRKREEIEKELKALTSQGVLSGFIVGSLPFFLILAIFFIDPQFIEPLFTTQIGIILLLISVLMEIFGIIFIRKIMKIE